MRKCTKHAKECVCFVGKRKDWNCIIVCGRGRYLTDEKTNCVMLCHDCHHVKVHGNLKYYRPILLEICEVIYGTKENV